MVLKLHGYAQSANVKMVAAVLHEKNVPFEFILIDMANSEHKSPAHLEKHPFGQVPYIDDDDFILYETRAITRYIAKKYVNQGSKLIPEGLKGEALFEQAASVEFSNFLPHVSGLLLEKFFKKFLGQDMDKAAYQRHRASLDSTLDVYDKILSKQEHLAGNEITLVDFFHLPFCSLVYAAGDGGLIDDRPNVKRWFDDISTRPSWEAVRDGVKGTA